MPILSTLADAARQTDVIVVHDVFRASNTIIELLAAGAERVVPVLEEAAARRLKAAHPDWLLLGERGGVRLPGFDGDNSPSGLPDGVAGKVAILTTSGGTRILDACAPGATVLIGSFANAAAVVAALHAAGAMDPTFWAVGEAGAAPAEEDVLCALYLRELFAGRTPDFALAERAARAGSGGDRLRRLGLHADLELCLQLDRRAIVPRREPWRDSLSCLVQ
jgi:2-phosphosulfolactate phosphatase